MRRGGPAGAEWTVLAERVVDASRLAHLSVATIRLPDGTEFEQYVVRAPRAAIVAAVDDEGRILMIRRHRFVIDAWGWELPGGYVDDDEDLRAAALRELEEETGWSAAGLERLVTYQPMTGIADHECTVFRATQVRRTGSDPDANEAQQVAWLPLDEARRLVDTGEILGAATVMAVLALSAPARDSGDATTSAPVHTSPAHGQ